MIVPAKKAPSRPVPPPPMATPIQIIQTTGRVVGTGTGGGGGGGGGGVGGGGGGGGGVGGPSPLETEALIRAAVEQAKERVKEASDRRGAGG